MKSSIQTAQIKLHSLEQIERNFKAPSSEAVKEAYAGSGLLGGRAGASGSGLLGGGGRGASGSGLLGGGGRGA